MSDFLAEKIGYTALKGKKINMMTNMYSGAASLFQVNEQNAQYMSGK